MRALIVFGELDTNDDKRYVANNLLMHGLAPSLNRLLTYGNTKLCCRGFVLALFQSTTAYKIDSEHTRDYTKLFPVGKYGILQVTVNRIEVLSSF